MSEGQLCKCQTCFAHSACQLGQSIQLQDHCQKYNDWIKFFLNSKNKHDDHVVTVAVVVVGGGDVTVGLILENVLLSP